MRCCSCRDGEHEDYDDLIELTLVKDPESGKVILRGYLCGEHREMYADDGFILTDPRTGGRK